MINKEFWNRFFHPEEYCVFRGPEYLGFVTPRVRHKCMYNPYNRFCKGACRYLKFDGDNNYED